ncbi:MAG: cupin domain-containing protein [Archangium sp.]
MSLRVINVAQAFERISTFWDPHVGGDINESQLKLVKLTGEFHWHHHEVEDELFFVVRGELLMKLRDGDRTIREGEFIVIPRGTEHCPVAVTPEVHCLLVEPKTTVNTGEVVNERTRGELKRV